MQEEAKGEVERERRQWRKAASRARLRHAPPSTPQSCETSFTISSPLRCACADHRERTGLNVPRKEYNGWLAALLAGADQPARAPAAAEAVGDTAARAALLTVDEVARRGGARRLLALARRVGRSCASVRQRARRRGARD